MAEVNKNTATLVCSIKNRDECRSSGSGGSYEGEMLENVVWKGFWDPKHNQCGFHECVSKAADSMAQGDFVEKGIMSVVNWSLLPIHIGPNERGMCTVIKIVLLETYVLVEL